MVSDSPETIKHPLDILNASDWAQKAGLQFSRITTVRSGKDRLFALTFSDDRRIVVSWATLKSAAKLSDVISIEFLKPVLLPKSKDMWVAYWLTYFLEAAEESQRDAGIDTYIKEMLSDGAFFGSFDSAREAARFFAGQRYSNPSLNEQLLFGAHVPGKTLLRTPVLADQYLARHGQRPDAHDIAEVLRREGYKEGYPIPCDYSLNGEIYKSSVFFWYRGVNGHA